MFEQMESNGTSRLHVFNDVESGLKAFIAIHSTARGPAIGGCRFIEYSCDQDAMIDALRLARGMSYKSALAGLPHGGAKSVIMKPKGKFNRALLMQRFGECVNSIKGDYITAMDSGTQVTDMDHIHSATDWVTCTSQIGDPSPYTALGVFEGIKSAVKFKLGRSTLKDVRVSIQGLGHVGSEVARLLHKSGAKLYVTDIEPARITHCQQQFDAVAVNPTDIYKVAADVFCPCGLGAIINDTSLNQLKVKIIAGSANNQLANESLGARLKEKDILYAPDYLINAGGLIFVALEYANQPPTAIRQKVTQIGDQLSSLFHEAKRSSLPINLLANQKAESIIEAAHSVHTAA